jgi:preprotein translocase subunit SecF
MMVKGKMKKNKKGQIGESIQDLVGLVIIAILLILFFVISNAAWGISGQETKDVSTQQYLHDQEHKALEAFMQKQVTVQEQEITMAELIRLSQIDQTYKSVLENEVKNAFDDIYTYNFLIISAKDTANAKGSSYYIAAKEPIIVNLEIKTIK